MLRKEVLREWKSCQEKVKQTIQELKAQHKDKWAVVKVKSAPQPVKPIPIQQLEDVEYCLRELASMDNRPPNQMLSPTDQVKYDQLKERLKELKKDSINSDWWRKILENQDSLIYAQQTAKKQQQELTMINRNYRLLNNQLNWLRTLVRAGEYEKLLELVRQAKI